VLYATSSKPLVVEITRARLVGMSDYTAYVSRVKKAFFDLVVDV
jgi:uncharacterized short protein YbdD (DUF466 family)